MSVGQRWMKAHFLLWELLVQIHKQTNCRGARTKTDSMPSNPAEGISSNPKGDCRNLMRQGLPSCFFSEGSRNPSAPTCTGHVRHQWTYTDTHHHLLKPRVFVYAPLHCCAEAFHCPKCALCTAASWRMSIFNLCTLNTLLKSQSDKGLLLTLLNTLHTPCETNRNFKRM